MAPVREEPPPVLVLDPPVAAGHDQEVVAVRAAGDSSKTPGVSGVAAGVQKTTRAPNVAARLAAAIKKGRLTAEQMQKLRERLAAQKSQK